jgi:hypothetical protein
MKEKTSAHNLTALRAKLSTSQQELLKKRLQAAQEGTSNAQRIPRNSYQGTAPLSFAQEWMWFLLDRWRDNPPSPIFMMPAAMQLKGKLNVATLEQSINEVVRRHESLRTTFDVVDGRRVQVIAPTLILRLPLIDLRALDETGREAETRRQVYEEARRLFDLKHGPLIRVTLLQLAEEEHAVLLTMHHIISDGWSMAVLTQELAALYEAFSTGRVSPLPELSMQYADYAIWQRRWLESDAFEKQLSYWKQQLDGASLVLELPTDRPRPAIQTSRGARQSVTLSKTLTEGLKELGRRERVSLFMTLLAAFNTLLYRYTGQADILVAAHIAGRNRVEVQELIGFFLNNLVLRANLSGNPSFKELLKLERDTVLEAFAHQDVPFLKLVETFNPQEDLSRSPLVQVLFVLENTPAPTLAFSNLALSFMSSGTGTATRDLILAVTEDNGELTALFNYNADLFKAETMKRMLSNYQALLEDIVAEPERRLSDLPLFNEGTMNAW